MLQDELTKQMIGRELQRLRDENALLREALDKAETRLLIFKEIQPPIWDDDDEWVLKQVQKALATTEAE